MRDEKVVSLADRVPSIVEARRRRANRTLIILLLILFAIISIVVYLKSPYSKVGLITTKGNSHYQSEEIIAQSEITSDLNVWDLKKKQLVDRLEELPRVKSAKLQLSFPNEIIITVEEYETKAYLIQASKFHPVLENGLVLTEETEPVLEPNNLLLFGFEEEEKISKLIEEIKLIPEEILNSISELHYAPTEMDKNQLILYMNDGYEVWANLRNFGANMSHYRSIVSQLDTNELGVIDLAVGLYFKDYNSINKEFKNKAASRENESDVNINEEE